MTIKEILGASLLTICTLSGFFASADRPIDGHYVPVSIVNGSASACFNIPIDSKDTYLNVGPALGEDQFLSKATVGADGRHVYRVISYAPIGQTVTFYDFRRRYGKSLVEYSQRGTELFFLETTSIDGQALSRRMDMSREHVIFHTIFSLIDENTLRVVSKKGKSADNRSFECILKRVP